MWSSTNLRGTGKNQSADYELKWFLSLAEEKSDYSENKFGFGSLKLIKNFVFS